MPEYFHIEPVGGLDNAQYIARFPTNTPYPTILANLARRYLRADVRELRVYHVNKMNGNSAKIVPIGILWRQNGKVCWGGDRNHYGIVDAKAGMVVHVKG